MDEKILERFYNRYDRYNTKVLKTLGETAKKFNNVDYMEAVIIAQGLEPTIIVDLLVELEAINALTMKDINEYLDIKTEGRLNYHKEHYEYRNTIPNNYAFKEITDRNKLNIINKLPKTTSIGFVMEDDFGNKIYRSIGDTYKSLIDKAVKSVALGKESYQSAMRDTIKQLADSGVKIHEEKIGYKNGYNRRIDSSVRQAILDGIRDFNQEMFDEIGKQIGADGVEIDVHFPCAIDHLDVQGQQYSNNDFDALQNDLERPIGTYNCRHNINPIILDIDKPQYSKKELSNIIKRNNKEYNYEGKKYTKYEASQEQRRLETAIRRQKDRQIISKASGDKTGIAKAQSKISELTSKYADFSKSMDLPMYKDRLSVPDYKRVSVK